MEVRFIEYSPLNHVVRFSVDGRELRAELSPGERVCIFDISNFNKWEQDCIESSILSDLFEEMAKDNRLLKKWSVRRRKKKHVYIIPFMY